mmetsp:Transcript_13160/g.47992  ORF Transcript_13160/g.47992 Transcript_13160/m.47992 type:complete len:94 (-) Transcript_13160:532-813(-)|eukprot:scaffold3319_cov427-Prasinococcus_capsulatus_cf.AAC.14
MWYVNSQQSTEYKNARPSSVLFIGLSVEKLSLDDKRALAIRCSMENTTTVTVVQTVAFETMLGKAAFNRKKRWRCITGKLSCVRPLKKDHHSP